MGGHGDPWCRFHALHTVEGIPVTELIDSDTLNAIVERTKKGGGEIVNLLGTSALVCARCCCSPDGGGHCARSEAHLPGMCLVDG